MAGSKPGPKKLTVQARDALWKVFHELGGKEHMRKWALDNPSDFYRLFARLVPQATEVTGEDGGPVQHELTHIALPPVVASLADWRARVKEVYGAYGDGAGAATGAETTDELQGKEGEGR